MVLRKHELEGKLGEERLMIKNGVLRDENPFDTSPEFKELVEACRRGDLRKCQELISMGANINGKDNFDYTPLIVVRSLPQRQHNGATGSLQRNRRVSVGTMNWSSYC